MGSPFSHLMAFGFLLAVEERKERILFIIFNPLNIKNLLAAWHIGILCCAGKGIFPSVEIYWSSLCRVPHNQSWESSIGKWICSVSLPLPFPHSNFLCASAQLVAGSVVMAFEEVCPDRIDLIHKNFRKLCNLLVDVEEWGQVVIMNMLTRYARTQFTSPWKGVRYQQSERECWWSHVEALRGTSRYRWQASERFRQCWGISYVCFVFFLILNTYP